MADASQPGASRRPKALLIMNCERMSVILPPFSGGRSASSSRRISVCPLFRLEDKSPWLKSVSGTNQALKDFADSLRHTVHCSV
jgi:hypothetical protein